MVTGCFWIDGSFRRYSFTQGEKVYTAIKATVKESAEYEANNLSNMVATSFK